MSDIILSPEELATGWKLHISNIIPCAPSIMVQVMYETGPSADYAVAQTFNWELESRTVGTRIVAWRWVDMPTPPEEGWLVHDGQVRPCGPKTLVDTKERDGRVSVAKFADCGGWMHFNLWSDIVMWRPTPKKTVEVALETAATKMAEIGDVLRRLTQQTQMTAMLLDQVSCLLQAQLDTAGVTDQPK